LVAVGDEHGGDVADGCDTGRCGGERMRDVLHRERRTELRVQLGNSVPVTLGHHIPGYRGVGLHRRGEGDGFLCLHALVPSVDGVTVPRSTRGMNYCRHTKEGRPPCSQGEITTPPTSHTPGLSPVDLRSGRTMKRTRAGCAQIGPISSVVAGSRCMTVGSSETYSPQQFASADNVPSVVMAEGSRNTENGSCKAAAFTPRPRTATVTPPGRPLRGRPCTRSCSKARPMADGISRSVTVTKRAASVDLAGRSLIASHLPETFSDRTAQTPRPTTPAPSPHATPHWQAHLSQRSECGSDPPHPERDSDAAGKTGRQDRGGSAKPLPRLAGL